MPPLSAARWLLVLVVLAGAYFFHGFLFPVLTAIVIAFAVTVLMLALAVIGHNDDTKRMPATGEERAT